MSLALVTRGYVCLPLGVLAPPAIVDVVSLAPKIEAAVTDPPVDLAPKIESAIVDPCD